MTRWRRRLDFVLSELCDLSKADDVMRQVSTCWGRNSRRQSREARGGEERGWAGKRGFREEGSLKGAWEDGGRKWADSPRLPVAWGILRDGEWKGVGAAALQATRQQSHLCWRLPFSSSGPKGRGLRADGMRPARPRPQRARGAGKEGDQCRGLKVCEWLPCPLSPVSTCAAAQSALIAAVSLVCLLRRSPLSSSLLFLNVLHFRGCHLLLGGIPSCVCLLICVSS